MKIIYKVGNLLNAPELVILHSCNASGKFASGVAKTIRERYPEAYADYMDNFKSGEIKLGKIFIIPCLDIIIINIIGQQNYGYDGKQYCDYAAIRECLSKANAFCQEYEIKEIAMPRIGAGLGGGNWEVIEQIIEEEFTYTQPVVYVLNEKEIPV